VFNDVKGHVAGTTIEAWKKRLKDESLADGEKTPAYVVDIYVFKCQQYRQLINAHQTPPPPKKKNMLI